MARKCLSCGTNLVKHQKKFCSNACQRQYEYTQYIIRWLDGEETGHCKGFGLDISHYVIRYLKEVRGEACEACGWNFHHPIDGKSLTEIDHVDGDASNCAPSNLRILCPNCHSLTPTFRSRNRGSTRGKASKFA